jgi:hypothetical protein
MEVVAGVENGNINDYYLPPSISAASSIFRLSRFRASDEAKPYGMHHARCT